jgi:hypothetical protein
LGLEGIFEIIVGNVMPEEVLDHRRAELLPEPRRCIPSTPQSIVLDLNKPPGKQPEIGIGAEDRPCLPHDGL